MNTIFYFPNLPPPDAKTIHKNVPSRNSEFITEANYE